MKIRQTSAARMICPRNRDNDTRFLPFQKKFHYASICFIISLPSSKVKYIC